MAGKMMALITELRNPGERISLGSIEMSGFTCLILKWWQPVVRLRRTIRAGEQNPKITQGQIMLSRWAPWKKEGDRKIAEDQPLEKKRLAVDRTRTMWNRMGILSHMEREWGGIYKGKRWRNRKGKVKIGNVRESWDHWGTMVLGRAGGNRIWKQRQRT